MYSTQVVLLEDWTLPCGCHIHISWDALFGTSGFAAAAEASITAMLRSDALMHPYPSRFPDAQYAKWSETDESFIVG